MFDRQLRIYSRILLKGEKYEARTKIVSRIFRIDFISNAYSGAAKVRADSDADDEANFGVRGNRITSDCVVNGAVLVIPQVPPPATTPSPDPCNGLVTPLINIPSANNRWSVDISWFNPETQKLYLADRNNKGVDIIDTKTNTVVAVATGFVGITPLPPLPNTTANAAGPNGVLVTNNPHQLWAGDGTGDIRVYSLDNKGTSPALLKIVSHQDPLIVALLGAQGAQRRADELAYDPDDQLVLMAWDDDFSPVRGSSFGLFKSEQHQSGEDDLFQN